MAEYLSEFERQEPVSSDEHNERSKEDCQLAQEAPQQIQLVCKSTKCDAKEDSQKHVSKQEM